MGTQPSIQSPFHKEMFGTRAQKILKIRYQSYLVFGFPILQRIAVSFLYYIAKTQNKTKFQ